ncbi:hypothetical protein [Domibacillus tundrae]
MTSQSIAMSSKPEIIITYAPGCVFITDKKDCQYFMLENLTNRWLIDF